MDVTPRPVARFVCFHHRVSGLLEVFCGVPSRSGVATGNVAAGQANAQLYWTLASRRALFTGVAAGFDLEIRFLHMVTLHHLSSLYNVGWMNTLRPRIRGERRLLPASTDTAAA